MRMISLLSLFVVAAFASGCGYNLHVVSEGAVYRSAQPFEEDLSAWVRKHKIKTVFRLRGGKPTNFWMQESREGAELGGARLFVLPMSPHRFPTREQLVGVVHFLRDAEYPILIHCKRGADRTGLVSAIAVLRGGGTIEEAHAELSFFPYGHLSAGDTKRMDDVITMYEPWFEVVSVDYWAEHLYSPPESGELPDEFTEKEAERVKEYLGQARSQKD